MVGALETSGFPISPALLIQHEREDDTETSSQSARPFGVDFATEPIVEDGVDPTTVAWDERSQTHLWPEATKKASTYLVSKWPGSVECKAD